MSVPHLAQLFLSVGTASATLTGTVPQPDISASPTSFNFGSVLVGSSSSTTFSISNAGTASLVVSESAISGTMRAISV